MLSRPVGRLRSVMLLEGVSYLALLGIAMPLKYWAGMPQAVRVVGTAHGGLFILMFAALAEVSIRRRRWSGELWGKAFIASLIPFGTFMFDRRLKQMEAEDAERSLVNAASQR